MHLNICITRHSSLSQRIDTSKHYNTRCDNATMLHRENDLTKQASYQHCFRGVSVVVPQFSRVPKLQKTHLAADISAINFTPPLDRLLWRHHNVRQPLNHAETPSEKRIITGVEHQQHPLHTPSHIWMARAAFRQGAATDHCIYYYIHIFAAGLKRCRALAARERPGSLCEWHKTQLRWRSRDVHLVKIFNRVHPSGHLPIANVCCAFCPRPARPKCTFTK